MTEQDVQKKIKDGMEAKGFKVTKYNANGYGETDHPDLFGSLPWTYHPIALYVEVKKPGGRLSAGQRRKIGYMLSKGHWVCVAEDLQDVWDYLALKGIRL